MLDFVTRALSAWLLAVLLAMIAGTLGHAHISEDREQKSLTENSEDPLPANAVARLGTTRFRHGGRIKAVVFSANGKQLVSGGDDCTLRFWDPSTGKPLRQVALQKRAEGRPSGGRLEKVTCLSFLPDGRNVIAGAAGCVFLCDDANGAAVLFENTQARVRAVAVSADGKLAAVGYAKGSVTEPCIQLYDVDGQRRLNQLPADAGEMLLLAFSPDDKSLVCGYESGIIQWVDVATGRSVRTIEAKSRLKSMAVSSDGTLVATGARNGTLSLWDAQNGVLRWQQKSPTTAVAISCDQKLLAACGERGTVVLWQIQTGKELRRIGCPATELLCVTFSPDNQTVVAGGTNCVVHRWKVENGMALDKPIGHEHRVTSVAFSPEGNLLASAGQDSTVRIWDIATAKEVRRFTGHQARGTGVVAYAPDGKTVVSGGYDTAIIAWDPATGREIRRWHVDKAESRVAGLAVSPDGKLLAAAVPGCIRLWELDTGREVGTLKNNSETMKENCIAFSSNGKLLALVDMTGMLTVFDCLAKKELWKVKTLGSTPTVGFTSDSLSVIAALDSEKVAAWDVTTEKELRQIDFGHVSYLAYSPAKGLLASCGGTPPNMIVSVKDGTTGALAGEFKGPRGYVQTMAFSRDGKLLAAAGDDTSILVWNVVKRLEK